MKRGGGAQMHVYAEQLNGCLRNLVGMKCSWPGTCIKMFWPYLPRGRSRAMQNRSPGGGCPFFKETSSSDLKATATNRIHSSDLEACGMKCCCFWFHSVVKVLTLESCLSQKCSLYTGER